MCASSTGTPLSPPCSRHVSIAQVSECARHEKRDKKPVPRDGPRGDYLYST